MWKQRPSGLFVPGATPVRFLDRDRDRDRDGMGSRAAGGGGGGGGGGGALEQLNALLATYTMDLNPVADNVTLVDGLVSVWTETGTVASTVARDSADLRPAWDADGGNGRPCVRIQGTSRRMQRPTNVGYTTYFAVDAAFMVSVFEPADVSGTRGIIEWPGQPTLGVERAGTTLRVVHRNTATFVTVNSSVALEADKRYIIAVRHLSGQLGISVNGGAWDEATSGDTDGPSTNRLWGVPATFSSYSALGKHYRHACRPGYPGDEAYAALVALLAEVYEVSV